MAVKYSFFKICIISNQYFSVFYYFVYNKNVVTVMMIVVLIVIVLIMVVKKMTFKLGCFEYHIYKQCRCQPCHKSLDDLCLILFL